MKQVISCCPKPFSISRASSGRRLALGTSSLSLTYPSGPSWTGWNGHCLGMLSYQHSCQLRSACFTWKRTSPVWLCMHKFTTLSHWNSSTWEKMISRIRVIFSLYNDNYNYNNHRSSPRLSETTYPAPFLGKVAFYFLSIKEDSGKAGVTPHTRGTKRSVRGNEIKSWLINQKMEWEGQWTQTGRMNTDDVTIKQSAVELQKIACIEIEWTWNLIKQNLAFELTNDKPCLTFEISFRCEFDEKFHYSPNLFGGVQQEISQHRHTTCNPSRSNRHQVTCL